MIAKSKNLIAKFSHGNLLKELERKGWRLPTLKEAKKIVTDFDSFWIQSETTIFDKRLAVIYNPKSDSVQLVNKNFIIQTVVIVEPEICECCINLYVPKVKHFKHECKIGVAYRVQDGKGYVILNFGCNRFERR